LNPMTDSDLRRWLRLQCQEPVGFVPWRVVRNGGNAIRNALDEASRLGEVLVVVDAISDEDLLEIGEAAAGVPLLTGGSGIALGLARNFAADRSAKSAGRGFEGIAGPEAIIAGSCSQATLQQIAYHAQYHPVMPIAVETVMDGALDVYAVTDFVLAHGGRAPLVYSSDTPEKVAALQDRYGRETVAGRLDNLFAAVARELVSRGIRRLVVAGGETSGAVVSALDLDALTIGPEIAPGVPVLTNKAPLALALKSGNFGQQDFFERALAIMEGKLPEGGRLT
jgi:uncharacterized protein YgbK (DUF1537 family)